MNQPSNFLHRGLFVDRPWKLFFTLSCHLSHIDLASVMAAMERNRLEGNVFGGKKIVPGPHPSSMAMVFCKYWFTEIDDAHILVVKLKRVTRLFFARAQRSSCVMCRRKNDNIGYCILTTHWEWESMRGRNTCNPIYSFTTKYCGARGRRFMKFGDSTRRWTRNERKIEIHKGR
jgi:hypothetical protein